MSPGTVSNSINRHFNSNKTMQLVGHSRCHLWRGQISALAEADPLYASILAARRHVLDDLSLQDRAVQRNVDWSRSRCRRMESSMAVRFRGQSGDRGTYASVGRAEHSAVVPLFRAAVGIRFQQALWRLSVPELPGPRGRSAQQEPACLPVSVRSPAPPLRQLLYQHQAASALFAWSRVLPDGR